LRWLSEWTSFKTVETVAWAEPIVGLSSEWTNFESEPPFVSSCADSESRLSERYAM
jgi:hypothetical protein